MWLVWDESPPTCSLQNTIDASHSFHLAVTLYPFICHCLHLSLDLSLEAPVLTNSILYHLPVVSISLSSVFPALSSVLHGQLRGAGREALLIPFPQISTLAFTLTWPTGYRHTENGDEYVSHTSIVRRMFSYVQRHLCIHSKAFDGQQRPGDAQCQVNSYNSVWCG